MPAFLNAYPRQVVLITTRAKIDVLGKEIEKDNIITIDWHMPVSFKPPLYAISIGKARLSHEMLRKSECFVVNFMPYSLKDKVLFCGRNSGKLIDKFKETGFTKKEASTIDCSVIKQSLAHIECSVLSELDAGDHTIFIGKVLKTQETKKGKRVFHTKEDNFTTTQ